jgi:cytidine deaminase
MGNAGNVRSGAQPWDILQAVAKSHHAMQQSRPCGLCRILLQDLPEREFLQLMEPEGSNVHARKPRVERLNEPFL